MASADVDIVNMALGHLGDKATVQSIAPPDQSVQAMHAAREYAHVRDGLLESFPWKFALRRATLAPRAELASAAWGHVYSEPNNCLRVVSVLPLGYTSDQQSVRFDTESDDTDQGLILTNTPNATARYIARVTNPGKFTPGFVQCFSWLLASALAGPLIKGESGRAEAIRCLQAGTLAYGQATTLSANQAKQKLDFMASSIAARGAQDAEAWTESYPIRGT